MARGLCPTLGRRPALHRVSPSLLRYRGGSICRLHLDGRTRTSNVWLPTRGPQSWKDVKDEKEDTTELLARAGFLNKAYSGVFHMLPLGLRVQEKIERLIDKHMRTLGASKVSLSSISAQGLWERTGRLNEHSDVFRFDDRKGSSFLLAPTHEEEITYLAGRLSRSYKHLPVRVYQISRKYRDEPRPRQGLLRGREFVMKDLYTFDYSNQNATKLYDTVKSTYMQLFEELKLPFLVAEASSGDMGGKLSHEFLLPSPQGEDTIIRCSNCDLTYNDEVADGKARGQEFAIARPAPGFATEGMHAGTAPTISNALWIGVSKDRRTLVRGWYPKYVMNMTDKEPLAKEASSHAIKAIARAAGVDLDLSVDNPLQLWTNQASSDRAFLLTRGNMPKVLDLYDSQVRAFQRPPLGDLAEKAGCAEDGIQYSMLDRYPGTADGLRLAKAQDGEQCPKCAQWSLTARSAIELGHTFHLGTRYTKPLRSVVTVPDPEGDTFQPGEKSKLTHMHMGCHGIGVSRMISAVADVLADKRGLNWPRVIAPYEVVVIAMEESQAPEAEKVYDLLASDQPSLDVILEDRDRRAPWLLTDADLIGFPVIVVVGRAWKKRQAVEVQCRRLNVKEEVPLDQLAGFVQSQLAKL